MPSPRPTALPALFFALTIGVLSPAPTRADPVSSPEALPPANISTLRVSATPERARYLLGETVRVRYAVTNDSPEPLIIRRENDTTFWRPESLEVAAFDAETGAALSSSPTNLDLFNHRYGRRHTIAPGETWTHDFFVLRHVDLPGPGRYRFRIRHTLGWPDKNAAPAAPEFVLEFVAPTPEQAAAVIASLPPLGKPSDDTPYPVDSYGFNHPVYIAPLLARIAAGEPALLDSLDRLATPESTAALIQLCTSPNAEVSRIARRKLLHRLPPTEGVTTFVGDLWPGYPSHRARHLEAWTPIEIASARMLARTVSGEELPAPDEYGLVREWDSPAVFTSIILASLGEPDDLPHVARVLQTVAYARRLDARAYRLRSWTLLNEEISQPRMAFAALHSRGARVSDTPRSLGEAILALDQARLGCPDAVIQNRTVRRAFDIFPPRTAGPRSAAWIEQIQLLAHVRPLNTDPAVGERQGHLGDPTTRRPPHPVLLIAALESVPAPLPAECMPFVEFCLESNVPQVVDAACRLAIETDARPLAPALERVLATESDPTLRPVVARTLAALGNRPAAMRALVEDLATTTDPRDLLGSLGALLFDLRQPAGTRDTPPPTRAERLALRNAWIAFIEHEPRLSASTPFLLGDPSIPATLFSNFVYWRRADGSAWPEDRRTALKTLLPER